MSKPVAPHPPDELVDHDPLHDVDDNSQESTNLDHSLSRYSTRSGQSSSLPALSPTSTSASCTTSSPRFWSSGTNSRKKLYLLDQFPSKDISFAKLPETLSAMKSFFHYLLSQADLDDNDNPLTLATKTAINNAAKQTAAAIKTVWRHHFGIRLIDGKDEVNGEEDNSKIMIIEEHKIAKKIVELFSEWKTAERLSRRPDRATTLAVKEATFRAKLDLPLNI